MPSTTDTDREERQPDKAYIEPFQRFYCEQINIDSCVSYPKLDSLASYLDKDFDQELERYLDKQTLLSLLMVGFNGKKRTTETTSTPAENKLAEDVKKGWLQQIREEKASVVITGANVGEGQQYKNLNALIKAGLAKIENPHKMHGDLVAICGRNVLADYPVAVALVAPMLSILGRDSFGVHLFAESSKGKSTTLHIANSIYGNPDKLKLSWSATAVGVKNEAAARNDGFLTLDEIGQAKDARNLESIAYDLFNETGKIQGKKEGGNREINRWKVAALSTGEKDLETQLRLQGVKVHAGQLVRLLNIPLMEAKELHQFSNNKAYAVK